MRNRHLKIYDTSAWSWKIFHRICVRGVTSWRNSWLPRRTHIGIWRNSRQLYLGTWMPPQCVSKKISEIVGGHVPVRVSERWTFSLIQAYHFCVMSALTEKEQARSLGNGLSLVWSDISITAVCNLNSGKIRRGNVGKLMAEGKIYVIRYVLTDIDLFIFDFLFMTVRLQT